MASAKPIELLSLPRELQLQVLQYTVAADFENLVVSCKALHMLAANTLIEKHNELRRRYRLIQFPSWDAAAESLAYHWGDTVLETLHRISREPVIASYVVHVNLTDAAVNNPTPSIFKRGDDGKPTEAEESIRQLLQASSYLRKLDSSPEFIDKWLQRILKQGQPSNETDLHNLNHATAFLLTLLPNVETLTLGSQWALNAPYDTVVPRESDPLRLSALDDVSKRAPGLIEMLVARANDETLSGQALSKLRVMYPIRYSSGLDQNHIITVVPFLALRSLREFYHERGKCEVENLPSDHYDDGRHHGSDKYWVSKLESANDAARADELQSFKEDDEDSEYVPDSDQDDRIDGDAGNDDDDDRAEYDDKEDNEEDVDDSSQDEQGDEPAEPRRQRLPVPRFDDHGRCFDSRYPTLGRNVELVNLDRCVIDPNTCRALLRDMRNLKTLRIHYSTGIGSDLDWDVQGCLVVLTQMLGSVLETLVLSAGRVAPLSDMIRLSMHEFTAMKHLELETVFFVDGLGDEPIEPLLYVLPPCLETFVLCVSYGDEGALPQLFERFTAERAEKLPALRSVTLRIRPRGGWGWGAGQLQELAEVAGKFASEYGLDVVEQRGGDVFLG